MRLVILHALGVAILHVVSALGSVSAGDWMLFVAELVVAGVIYLELEHGRDVAFLQRASDRDADTYRRTIYQKFVSLPGSNVEKIAAFQSMISQSSDEGAELRNIRNNQLAVFTEMGFELSRIFKYRKRRFLAIFPHAPVQYWYIVGPFILKRRALTGPWFGLHALKFVEKSFEFVLKNLGPEEKLVVGLPQGETPWVITRPDMERMKRELVESIKNYKVGGAIPIPPNVSVP